MTLCTRCAKNGTNSGFFTQASPCRPLRHTCSTPTKRARSREGSLVVPRRSWSVAFRYVGLSAWFDISPSGTNVSFLHTLSTSDRGVGLLIVNITSNHCLMRVQRTYHALAAALLTFAIFRRNSRGVASAPACGAIATFVDWRVVKVVLYDRACREKLEVGEEPTLTHALYKKPDTHSGHRAEPILGVDVRRVIERTPDISVVMSVYNSEQSLAASLPSLFSTATGHWELIVVLDACHDGSYDMVLYNIRTWFNSSSCLRVRVIIQPTAVWEVSSDNIGLRISSPTHAYVLLQADNIMLERDWDVRMLSFLRRDSNVFAISARCAHDLNERNKIGRCGVEIGIPLRSNIEWNVLTIRDTVNRGPLMLRSEIAQKLGFMDEISYFLDGDDHDLMRRARALGYTVGYLPVNMFAPIDLSPRRNPSFASATPEEVRSQELIFKEFRLAQASRAIQSNTD